MMKQAHNTSLQRTAHRRRSKQLLAFSTEAVEMAIEKDVSFAMKWLKEQTQNNC